MTIKILPSGAELLDKAEQAMPDRPPAIPGVSYDNELFRGRVALKLLRRVNDGDETALKEVEAFINALDEKDVWAAQQRAALRARSEKRRTSGRKNSGRFEIAPANEGGIAWSASGIVLLKKDGIRLVWRSGGNYWSSRTQSYGPAELTIIYPTPKRGHATYKDVTDNFTLAHKGGKVESRLSRALIEKYAPKIDEVFGPGAAAKISLKHTIEL